MYIEREIKQGRERATWEKNERQSGLESEVVGCRSWVEGDRELQGGRAEIVGKEKGERGKFLQFK